MAFRSAPYALLMLLLACSPGPSEPKVDGQATPDASAYSDRALAELLTDAVVVEGDVVRADDFVLRLAFASMLADPEALTVDEGQAGVRVAHLAIDSPAHALGLREGDRLVSVDDQPLASPALLEAIAFARPREFELTLEREGTRRTLTIRSAELPLWGARPSPRTDIAPRVSPRARSTDFAGAIRCTGTLEPMPPEQPSAICEVLQERLDALRANPATLMTAARIVPQVDQGQSNGYRLFGIRSGTIFDRLGLRNGDQVTALDGTPLDSLEVAMEVWERVATKGELELVFEREDRAHRLVLRWVDTLSGPALDFGRASGAALDLDGEPQPGSSDALCSDTAERCAIDRAKLTAMLDTATRERDRFRARWIPTLRDGKPVGLKVYAIRPGSPHARLGVKNGDTVVQIDGVTPAEAIDQDPLLDALRRLAAGEVNEVDARLLRRGAELNRRFEIE